MDKTMLPYRLVLPLLCGYFLITLLGLYYHELALEEAQFFLFGRDSSSLSALYHNMQYEGHPRLWCSLLYLVIHYITPGYAGMQVLHLAVTTATVFIFLRYAPFNLLSKILIMGSYYLLFEYDILSRSYSLGILLLFGCCVLLRPPGRDGLSGGDPISDRKLLWIGLLLLLLCNTHLFFSFAAIGIFLYVFADRVRQKKVLTLRFFLFSGLVLTGVVSTLLQGHIPAEDKLIPIIPGGWHTAKNFSAASYSLIRGWLPIPNISSVNFWNTFWLDDKNIGSGIRTLLFGVLLLFPAFILKKYGKAMLFYYTTLLLLFVFFLILPMVASRYFGVGYIAFLAACWLAGNTSSASLDFFRFGHVPGLPLRAALQVVLYGIFVVQALIGVYAFVQDLRRPFSQAKNAISYIKEHRLDNQEMVVDGYIAGPALSVYSGRQLYYLNIEQKGSYCIWRKSYLPSPAPALQEELSHAEFLRGLDQFILIANRPMDAALTGSGDSNFNFTLLSGFPNSITGMENSYIYQAKRKTGNPAPPRLTKL